MHESFKDIASAVNHPDHLTRSNIAGDMNDSTLNHPDDITKFWVDHPDDLAQGDFSSVWVTRVTYDGILWHPDDLSPGGISFGLKDNQYAIQMTYDTTISYPDNITKFEPYVPDYLTPGGISSECLIAHAYFNRMTYGARLIHPDYKTTFDLSHREIGESNIAFRTWISHYTTWMIQYDYSLLPVNVCP